MSLPRTDRQKEQVAQQLSTTAARNKVFKFFFPTAAAIKRYKDEMLRNFTTINSMTVDELRDPEALLRRLGVSDKDLEQYYMEYILFLLGAQQGGGHIELIEPQAYHLDTPVQEIFSLDKKNKWHYN